jgi:ABC-type lipoprotein export system ATPase subunit
MITLTSLSKIYRTDEIETVALENVNLTVDRGEFLSIMGPSGCGKWDCLMHPQQELLKLTVRTLRE